MCLLKLELQLCQALLVPIQLDANALSFGFGILHGGVARWHQELLAQDIGKI